MKRLWASIRRRRLDRDLDDEIAAHLAMLEAEFRRAGMSDRDAQAAARREFGGVARIKEIYRERRGLPWAELAAADLRYAARGLWHNKGFAAAAVLSLALGIGANTAIFTLFRALMLRMLPVERPRELVMLNRTGAWGNGCSWPFYLEIAERADLFQGAVARSDIQAVTFSAGGERVERARREYISGNYFDELGVGAAAGRLIREPDNRTPHAHPVAVLSYHFWQSRFGADPEVIGRKIVVSEEPLTVVGVAARGFRGVEVDHEPDVWEPAMMRPGQIMEPGTNWAWIVARRRPEVSRTQVQAAMDVMFGQYLSGVYGSHPNAAFRRVAMSQRIEVRDAGVGLSALREQFGTPLNVLMAAVGLVLLAACANVANLLLARGAARRKEMALRVSLGATRGRLIARALMESLLLGACGAALGLALAYWGARTILRFLPPGAADSLAAAPDATVLAFTIAISLAAAMLCGLAPALRSTAIDPTASLQSGDRQTGRQARLRSVLVTVQVAFSVILVALAGLFGHSMAELRAVDTGFRRPDAIAFTLQFPRSWKPADTQSARERFLKLMEAMPGAPVVSYSFPGPYQGGSSSATVRVPGSEATAKEPAWVSRQYVAPGYFDVLGAALVAGRPIDRTDTAQSRSVAVVNEAFVRQFLPNQKQVLERVLETGDAPTYIVGVARDMAHAGLREKIEPVVYVSTAQAESGWEPTIVMRTALPPESLIPAIRRELRQLGPQVAISEPRTIRQRIDESLFQDRLLATLGGLFGFLALTLAAVGLYGVVAYGTARRAREIGIRIARGARRRAVVWMVLRDALVLVAAGLAIGLPASYAAARQVAALLFGIKPLDTFAFTTTAAVLAGIGLTAALLPARRASTLDPLAVLRQD
jgi:predicted permease